jgi:hypothetical protein
MSSRVAFRRGKAADWAQINPVLFPGEPGLEIDTDRLKLGDGQTRWLDLPYTVLNSNKFVPNTKVIISSAAPVSPPRGSIWILCESGGAPYAPTPVPPPILAYVGTADLTSVGTLQAFPAPTFAGSLLLLGTGTLGTH